MKADELLDHVPIKFGKYKGMTTDKIAEDDPSYIVWAYSTCSPKPCSEALYKSCKEDLEESGREDDEDNFGDAPDTFDRFNGDL